jgi:ActR/RegA family two-component response regulator
MVDGLQIIKSKTYRLAIVDLSLADSDHTNHAGLRILEAVHRLDPGCQTIRLTGFATVELAVSVLTEYGAFTFLRKENFHRAEFLDVVKRALVCTPPPKYAPALSYETTISNLDSYKDAAVYKKKVLVVEDDAGWRNILAELLADAGHEVQKSASFGEALRYLRREKYLLAVIDLSLTDAVVFGKGISNENLEGYQLLNCTRSEGIPTIVISGITSPVEIQRTYMD